MRKKQGFLVHDLERDKYWIDWRESLSIVVNELLLKELLAARQFMKGRLLDVGCGKRPYGLIYDALVEKSFGTEVAFSPHGTLMADVICYGESLPFAKDSFDTILCTEVLEHTQQPFLVMKEFARLLKPEGTLILSVPFIYPIHEAPHDYWRFTEHGLNNICESAGLNALYIHSKNGIGSAILALWVIMTSWVLNMISKVLPLSKPLRDFALIRWLLAMPQRIYIGFSRKLTVPARVAQVGAWMTPGYVMLAKHKKNRSDLDSFQSNERVLR